MLLEKEENSKNLFCFSIDAERGDAKTSMKTSSSCEKKSRRVELMKR